MIKGQARKGPRGTFWTLLESRPFLAALVVCVTVLSFLPHSSKSMLHTHGRYHGWGHFLIFGFVALVLTRRVRGRALQVAILFAIIAFGCSVEVTQHILYPGQPLEWADIGVDAGGAILGGTLSLLAQP